MKLLRFLILITLGTLAIAQVKNHTCVPSGYSRICLLEDIYYERNGTTTHVFPEKQSHVRIGSIGSWVNKHSHIPYFDAELYLMLGKPPILEAMNVGIETLDILTTLKHANFADNNIRTTWVTGYEDDNAEPALVYLDLSQNWLRQLPNGIGKLVNLEVLNLGSNSLDTIPPNTLTRLTKLRIVNLFFNNLHQLSTELFPTSLTHLDLYYNNLAQLEYANLHFPALETLNLERNHLRQIDASALILAMPALKIVGISGNSIGEDQLRTALGVFRRRNITFRNDADEEACFHDENTVEGVCLPGSSAEPMGVAQAVVFTVMVVMVGVVFVLVTRWVLRAMNK
ncbi:conserved hypothetical protein [Culex quinquefasciatus]|uniref:Uncharacterized protein n=1 Tax=Culex quinquefasciatus TaxID=7176 RepID=B0WYQ3_CULQU|nr:conserved hypothetical protein [Culex quinquefasciatus]|eukprot:XP_001862525.1 conserved hypothetical protein [Culex quinquefasciatus]